MNNFLFSLFLFGFSSFGLVGCFHRGEQLSDNPQEYRDVLGTVYVTKTPFDIYKHPEKPSKRDYRGGDPFYYTLYPSTEGGHIDNRYSRHLGRLAKGARLRVVSIKQGVESKKVAYIVKIEESEDEVLQGEQAVIRAFTAHPALYVQDEAGYWDLSRRWVSKEEG